MGLRACAVLTVNLVRLLYTRMTLMLTRRRLTKRAAVPIRSALVYPAAMALATIHRRTCVLIDPQPDRLRYAEPEPFVR